METEKFKLTVFEHLELGIRTYTSYSENVTDENGKVCFKIIAHVNSDREAQELCNKTKDVNFKHFKDEMVNDIISHQNAMIENLKEIINIEKELL